MENPLRSWGRYPVPKNQAVIEISSRLEHLPKKNSLLAYGQGKSYGDVCLNENGTLISTRRLNHFISFDKKIGTITCESGVLLSDILQLIIPHGWFLPVVPGIKYISVGGAIANEVHGKNHATRGTFCHHLLRFELLRSDGSRLICSPTENTELFKATCGGIGLTGLITWAQLQLRPITSTYLESETIKTTNLTETLNLFQSSRKEYEYTVASINTSHKGSSIGAGYFFRGNHTSEKNLPQENSTEKSIALPAIFPFSAINNTSSRLFNALYFHKQFSKQKKSLVHYNPFFFPQDTIKNWNYAYGPNGFLQYQCQIPLERSEEVLKEILATVRNTGTISFLATIKLLGEKPSLGPLAFPAAGYTLAMDFPNTGKPLQDLFVTLDAITKSAGGKLYLAKDAAMSASMFQASYPEWQTFAKHIDPAFSSSMWRRLTKTS